MPLVLRPMRVCGVQWSMLKKMPTKTQGKMNLKKPIAIGNPTNNNEIMKRSFLSSCVRSSIRCSMTLVLFNHVFIATLLFLTYLSYRSIRILDSWQMTNMTVEKWFLQIWWMQNLKHDGYGSEILVACLENRCVFWLVMSKKLC